jgi:RNA polymerase sigma-70 factor (ECF subfamily)
LGTSETAHASEFSTTHWSVVLAAGGASSPPAVSALEELCRRYWYPLYAYVRRQGHGPQDAQDLTQAFFTRLLEQNSLRLADPNRGRFRSFLLVSLKHFLISEWHRAQAERRGGGAAFVPWEAGEPERLYAAELPARDAECLFDKRWAVAVLDRGLGALRAECHAAGREGAFESLKAFISGETATRSQAEVARELGMTEGAVAVMTHRLRVRFRELLRGEIAQTVAASADIDDELRYLARVMSR